MSRSQPELNPWTQRPPYRVPRHPAVTDLQLGGNEGAPPPQALAARMGAMAPEQLSQYPDPSALERRLAARHGLHDDQVLITAGGDEGLQRLCRAALAPGKRLVLPEPTFEMIRRFAESTGAEVIAVPFQVGGYPTERVIEACDDSTALIAVVTPNNPTGDVISADDLRRVAEAAPQALVMVDLAYTEFADEDLTQVALSLPNAIIFRTFSKARGLAGLRLGYALGAARWIRALRTAGLPYPASAPALALALASLEEGADEPDVSVQVWARQQLESTLRSQRVSVNPSQGNFVFARGLDGAWWRDAMAGLGVQIRTWPDALDLADAVRISCPLSVSATERVSEAIRIIRSPEAVIFDLDGVLADVSASYRRAIGLTCLRFGVRVTAADIEAVKAQGDANNDWVVTWRLIRQAGGSAELDAVTAAFESLYQGVVSGSPLWRSETLVGRCETLRALAVRFKLAVVTGRPRRDAIRFLRTHQLEEVFAALVCMEDAPPKPSPEPVRMALNALGVRRAWMVGDTPDDVLAARAAGVLPLGVRAAGIPSSRSLPLLKAGAARVLDRWDELLEVLP